MFRLFRMKSASRPPASPWDGVDPSLLDGWNAIGLETRIRTLAAKTDIPVAQIEEMAEAYVAAGDDARIDVSRPCEIPGLRRLILLGPLWSPEASSDTFQTGLGLSPYIGSHNPGRLTSPTLYGVTDAGLLFLHRIDRTPEDRRRVSRAGDFEDDTRVLSTAEAFRLAIEAPDRLRRGGQAADIGVNRYSNFRFKLLAGPVRTIITRTLEPIPESRRREVPYGFIRGLEHVTRGFLGRRLALALHALNESIDPDILHLARRCAINSAQGVAWMCGAVEPDMQGPGPGRLLGCHPEAQHDGTLREARLQALRSYPAMGRMIIGSPDLTALIDQRAPLAPAIAARLNAPVSGVKLLSGMTWQMAGVSPSNPRDGLAGIALIPRDLAPSCRAEFRMVPRILEFSTLLCEPMPDVMRRFARGGSPYRFKAELERTSASDIRDALRHVTERLLMPARLRALRDLLETGNFSSYRFASWALNRDVHLLWREHGRVMAIRDLFDLSERWHHSFQRHEDRLVTLQVSESWTPLLGEVHVGPAKAREMASLAALKQQGRAQGHCVGGYSETVLRSTGRSIMLIFSLEAGDTVLGTAQIEMKPARTFSGWMATIIQNRASHNDQVDAQAEKAARQLCQHLESLPPGKVQAYLDGLAAVRERRARLGDLSIHIQQAGYDIWDDGQFANAWQEMSDYLPRAARKAGPDALVARGGRVGDRSDFPDLSGLLEVRAEGQASFWTQDQVLIRKFLEQDAARVEARRDPEPTPALPAAEVEEWMPF